MLSVLWCSAHVFVVREGESGINTGSEYGSGGFMGAHAVMVFGVWGSSPSNALALILAPTSSVKPQPDAVPMRDSYRI
jgi:hypothetical protein